MKPGAQRQQEYRARLLAKSEQAKAMTIALEQIVARLAGNEKPLAVEIRAIAMHGLGR